MLAKEVPVQMLSLLNVKFATGVGFTWKTLEVVSWQPLLSMTVR
jgi:hypothetical protein